VRSRLVVRAALLLLLLCSISSAIASDSDNEPNRVSAVHACVGVYVCNVCCISVCVCFYM